MNQPTEHVAPCGRSLRGTGICVTTFSAVLVDYPGQPFRRWTAPRHGLCNTLRGGDGIAPLGRTPLSRAQYGQWLSSTT